MECLPKSQSSRTDDIITFSFLGIVTFYGLNSIIHTNTHTQRVLKMVCVCVFIDVKTKSQSGLFILYIRTAHQTMRAN